MWGNFLIFSSLLLYVICIELKVTHKVYFDVSIDGEKHNDRIVIGLFGNVVPKTVKNFLTIATKGIKGKTYAGTKFHRAVKKFLIQGGDIVNNDGSGSLSIYGDHFPDENFHINHTGPGFVSMSNFGPHSNGCQFFITSWYAPSLDGFYVVFGKVLEGQNVVHAIEHLKTDYRDSPVKEVLIKECGEIPVTETIYVSGEPYWYIFWIYFKAIAPPLGFSLLILGIFQWMIRRLDSCLLVIEDDKES